MPIPVAAGGPALGWLPEWEPREETRVPYVDNGEARIWYTEQGTGFPMLTLAPGGMRSGVSLWEVAAINPLTRVCRAVQDDRDGPAQRRPVRWPA